MDKPWKVIFAFVGVFIAGAVFGAFFSLRSGGRLPRMQQDAVFRGNKMPGMPPMPPQQNQPQPPTGAMQPIQSTQVMRRYAERLDLTPGQRDRIQPLIQRATEDLRRKQQDSFRENDIILRRLQQDIAKELTGGQRARLEKMEQRQREIMQQRMGNAEPGGPGPRAPNAGRDGFRGDGPRPPTGPPDEPSRPQPPDRPVEDGRK